MRRSWLLLILLSWPLAAAGTGGGPEAPGPGASADRYREEALVRRIRWPVRFVPRLPGGCDDIAPGRIEVREDGVAIVPDAVERAAADAGVRPPLDTLHAILIDTSISMEARLLRARRAAEEYVRGLPGDDPVMLASFSDNLVLHAPPTRDRDGLVAALQQIDVRSHTALHDGLHYLIRYLRSRPERKALIVLTDGCDSASLPLHPIHEVIELAEESESLAVFPIGVDLPASCFSLPVSVGPANGPEVLLERLARRTGGRLFKTDGAFAVSGIFRAIRERLEREGFVIYRPIPFGEGPRDRPESTDRRRRRVKVRSSVPGRCRVVSAGPEVRVERRDPREPGPLGDASLLPGLDRHVPFEDGWTGEPGEKPAFVYLARNRIEGRAADILAERARLYAPVAYRARGRYRTLWDAPSRVGRRDFELRVPPFELLRRRMSSPEALLLYLLETEPGPFSAPESPEGRRDAARRELAPLWIHGQTLLELRELFGQLLFIYPGYREFAEERLREEHRERMRRTLASSSLPGELPAPRLQALRDAIEGSQPDPLPAHLQRYLAEWLGDLPARDLVVGFERWATNRILEAEPPGAGATRLLELIDRRWAELGEWFPPPTQVRIITPLVPTFDPRRQRVGFYRVLLPQVAGAGPPPDAVPPVPLGLTFVRHLLERGGPGMAGRLWLHALDYDAPPRHVRKRMIRGARVRGLLDTDASWRRVPMVRLRLGEKGDAAPLDCTVLYEPARPDAPAAASRPLCVRLAEAEGRPGTFLSAGILELLPRCQEDGTD